MKIEVHRSCADFDSYRAARVKSLFNCDSGANFDLEADLPIDDAEWRVGVVVGPSGSGKTSIGRTLWPDVGIYAEDGWPEGAPIVDGIAPGASFDLVTGALASVGLGSVPVWLKPYGVLSNGEKFRANLARIIAEAPPRVIVDEFSSVVDRQIARVGAGAFSKAWKRTGGQAVLLSCHYDILDWLEPDWVFDTQTRQFHRGSLWRRPRLELEVLKTDGSLWPLFEPHHYLKLPRMPAAWYYVGRIDGELMAHIAVAPNLQSRSMRACRMVVMPEWQGAGVGMRFLNEVCRLQVDPATCRFPGRVTGVIFHTSHPGLCAALRRDAKWRQVSAQMGGNNKKRSNESMARSYANRGEKMMMAAGSGYGGHFRAVQGFRYIAGAG